MEPRPERVAMRKKVIAWLFVALMFFSAITAIALIFQQSS